MWVLLSLQESFTFENRCKNIYFSMAYVSEYKRDVLFWYNKWWVEIVQVVVLLQTCVEEQELCTIMWFGLKSEKLTPQ